MSVCMVYVRCVCMLEAAKNRRRKKNRGWVRLVKCDLKARGVNNSRRTAGEAPGQTVQSQIYFYYTHKPSGFFTFFKNCVMLDNEICLIFSYCV